MPDGCPQGASSPPCPSTHDLQPVTKVTKLEDGIEAGVTHCYSSRGDIIPLIGAHRRERPAESLGALELGLSELDLAQIEASVPANAVAGDRYDAFGTTVLDSER